MDHSKIQYEPFRKGFYRPHEVTVAMSFAESEDYKRSLGLQVSGRSAPAPIKSFVHAGFEAKLLTAIAKAGFEAPTPIQAAALPAALSGRDVIGIAKTGSGKTLAFAWPMVVHVMDQRVIEKGEGPIRNTAAVAVYRTGYQ